MSVTRTRYRRRLCLAPLLALALALQTGWNLPSAHAWGKPRQASQRRATSPPSPSPKPTPPPTPTPSSPSPSQRPRAADHTLSLPNWCSVGAYARNSSEPLYTTMTRTSPSYKIYHNAYWHAHKWYAVLPPSRMLHPGEAHLTGIDATDSGASSSPNNLPTHFLEEGLSVNTAMIKLPVINMTAFGENIRAGFLPGTTLLVDFPFPAFPDNLGHWAEIMLGTYSVLADGGWRDDAVGSAARGRFVDRILLPNVRKEMNDWFKEILALAVSPGVRRGGAPVPPLIDHADLEAFPKLSWLLIENLLVIQDRYTHPERKTGFIGADHGDLWRYDGCARYVNEARSVGFSVPEHAADFRAAAYRRAGLPAPPEWSPGSPQPPLSPGHPRLMTLLLAHEDYPAVVNWEEVQALLRRVGSAHGLQARTVTLSTDAPFSSHLDTFARSSVVVARHGPLLATAALMAPGSAVFELLPYKWEWHGISKLYYNMTQSAGDLHHFAWRALDHTLAHYDHENYTRYHTWTPEECSARECLMVHARAGMTVKLEELESILSSKLPGLVGGKSVQELQEPWPKAV